MKRKRIEYGIHLEGLRKSVGHLEFAGRFEFYEQDGEVYRAPVGNAFDLEGRRHGRWEGSLAHFRRNRGYIYPPQDPAAGDE